ncbi:unnamed protein product, partial [Candidula unifasciata]
VAITSAVRLRQSPIISFLTETSNPDIIPILDSSDGPLQVVIDLSLLKIVDVDTDRNEIEILLRQRLSWTNPALAWSVSWEEFNETSVSLATKYLWLPDIVIYNAINLAEVVSPSAATVRNNGEVILVSTVRVRVPCDLQNITSNSGANCTLKFASWTRNGNILSISNPGSGIDLTDYLPIPNYDLLSTSSKKNSITYTCCPDVVYEDIVFQFLVKTRNQAVSISE